MYCTLQSMLRHLKSVKASEERIPTINPHCHATTCTTSPPRRNESSETNIPNSLHEQLLMQILSPLSLYSSSTHSTNLFHNQLLYGPKLRSNKREKLIN
ncbi:hypothetical protein M758_12G102600 [Ceratodon purpureus]|nr:hypothetical protein M758_12G102600 [Ceratodon purpureus]